MIRQVNRLMQGERNQRVSSRFDSRLQTQGVNIEPNNNSIHSTDRSGLTLCLPERPMGIYESLIVFVNFLGGRELKGNIPQRGKILQLRNAKHRARERKTNSRTSSLFMTSRDLHRSRKQDAIAWVQTYPSQSASTWALSSSFSQAASHHSRHFQNISQQFSLCWPPFISASWVAGPGRTCLTGSWHALLLASGTRGQFPACTSAA